MICQITKETEQLSQPNFMFSSGQLSESHYVVCIENLTERTVKSHNLLMKSKSP